MNCFRILGEGTLADPFRFEMNGVPRDDIRTICLHKEFYEDDALNPVGVTTEPSRYILTVNDEASRGDWELIQEAKNLRYLYRNAVLTVYAL